MLSTACCLAAPRPVGLAQTLPPQTAPPTFRSTVDLLTIDTSVRDKGGLPNPDLQASDFTVTIDGRPRKVLSAVFFAAGPAAGSRVSGGAALTPRHVSNDGAQSGRAVVFALDADSIRQGKEKALFDTASRMLDRFSPADAVGLIVLPSLSMEMTRDRRVIAAALKAFRGRAPREPEEKVAGGNLPDPSSNATSMKKLNDRAHAVQVLMDLAALVRRMAVVRAPRSVILISGGLAFDIELLSLYAEVQRAAAESRVTLYTVLIEQVGYEMSRGETRPDVAVDPALADGLAAIASRTGGMFFTGIARAVGVFDRLASEVTSFYQLGLESSPADADGKEHDVKVRVNRSGLDVRAPSHVAMTRSSRVAPADPLLVALQQPTDVPDVPLAVTTYSTRPGAGIVHLLISTEVGALHGAAPAEWAVMLSPDGIAGVVDGRSAVTRRGRFAAGSESPRIISTTVEVPPGDYRLRVAAVDAEERIGVLEVPITAGYQIVAPTVLSDLMVGVVTGDELEPRWRIAKSEEIAALLEVNADSGAVLGGTLQLIPGGSARSVLNTPLKVRPSGTAGEPAKLDARATLAALPPGRYTASAAVTMDGQPVTRVDRVIEITGTQPGTTLPAVVPPVAAEAPVVAPAEPSVATPAAPSVAPPAPSSAPAGSPDENMRRVGAYVEHYGGQASLLVAAEHYSQSVTQTAVATLETREQIKGMAGNAPVDGVDIGPTPITQRRRLVSEFALVANASTSGGWLGYRDVIEVDGKPVADGRNRLEALFRSDTPDLQEARRIADESARYNIGPVSRNFNVPTTTLFFFHSANLSRFTFNRKGRERIDGVDTIAIDFRETRSPTLIMNSAGRDVPSSGTLWVNALDGAVVRSRLELEKFDDIGSRAVIEVHYRKDPVLAMWVPSRMTESYSGTSGAGASKATAKTEAIYRDYKRFQTSVKIK